MLLSKTSTVVSRRTGMSCFLHPCAGLFLNITPGDSREYSRLSTPTHSSRVRQDQPDPTSSSSPSSSSFLSVGLKLSAENRRGLHVSAAAWKGVNPPITDNRNVDIDINPDEIEFVGRKLRKFQMDTTGQMDPLPSEIEPSPLHLVTLTKSYGGNVWWLKKILWEFGMYRDRKQTKKYPEYQKAIVPNTPENNQKLAKIKHCVRIDRVTFPYGYPETEEDLKHMRISEHGEVTFVKNVESHVLDDGSVATVPLGVPREAVPEEMDEETIKIEMLRMQRKREFLDEYHPEYDNRMLGQANFPGMKIHWKKDKPPITY